MKLILVLLLVIVQLGIALSSDDCFAYYNSSNEYEPKKACGPKKYCCGTCHKRHCCSGGMKPGNHTSLSQSKCENNAHSSHLIMYGIYITLAIIGGVFFVVFTICFVMYLKATVSKQKQTNPIDLDQYFTTNVAKPPSYNDVLNKSENEQHPPSYKNFNTNNYQNI